MVCSSFRIPTRRRPSLVVLVGIWEGVVEESAVSLSLEVSQNLVSTDMRYFQQGWCLVLLVHGYAVYAQRTADQLFDVSYDATVGGNCGNYGATTLNNMVADATTLANLGVAMVDAATNPSNALHGPAVRAIAAWFTNPAMTAAQYATIRSEFWPVGV
jgi:hypothetical protein